MNSGKMENSIQRLKVDGSKLKPRSIRNHQSSIYALICSALFIPNMAYGQMKLDSILSIVRERNPMLTSYRQRAEAMTSYADGARGWMAPEVGGGLWMVPYKEVSDPRDKGQIMLSVQQKFTNPAKLKANENYMHSKAAVEHASESYVFNELRAQARKAYYQWMVLEKKKAVLKENEEIIDLVLKVAQVRYAYNQGKLGNIYKAEARLQEIRNMMLMNDNQIEQKNILLNQLMNIPLEQRFRIDTSRVEQQVLTPVDTTLLARERSDIRRIDQSIQSIRYSQALENSQNRPDFNLSFNHMIARGHDMPNQFMLLGMISIPIAPWASKGYKSNVKGMDREIDAMKSERAFLLNEVHGMTNGMLSELKTLDQQLDNYRKRIIPSLKKNYETVMLAYEQNKEELPVVIDAWEALNATQMQYLDTVGKYFETIVNYEKQIEK